MENSYKTVRRLMLATNKINGAYYVCARKLGVNENTLALLYALDDGRAHSQKQISDEWLIPKTTVNTIVKELASAGYVALLTKEHSREKTVSLTKSGKAYTREILRTIYEVEQAAWNKTLQQYSAQFEEAFDYFADCLRDGFKIQA